MSVLVVALLSTACVGQETAGGLSGRTLQDPPPLAPDYRWDEDTHATLFGRAACALDDLDGDGYAEFAVGAPMAWSAAGRTGSVLVFSGRDPEVLFRVDGRGHGAGLGGDLIAVADLDGDGVRELAIGSFDGAQGVRVVSLGKRATLFDVYGFTRCLGEYGDRDGDGTTDLLLDRDGDQTVVSGVDGVSLGGAPGWPAWPRSAYAIGDATGDGFSDFLAEHGAQWPRDVLLHSGIDGIPLHRVASTSDRWRCAVGRVGEPAKDSLFFHSVAHGTASAVVELRGIGNGELLRAFHLEERELPPGDAHELFLFAPGDLDGDGSGDFVASDRVLFGTRCAAYSGLTGARLWKLDEVLDHTAEVRFDTLGDRNGDGAGELLVSSVGYLDGMGPPQKIANGRVLVLSGRDGAVLHRLDEGRFSKLLAARAPRPR